MNNVQQQLDTAFKDHFSRTRFRPTGAEEDQIRKCARCGKPWAMSLMMVAYTHSPGKDYKKHWCPGCWKNRNRAKIRGM